MDIDIFRTSIQMGNYIHTNIYYKSTVVARSHPWRVCHPSIHPSQSVVTGNRKSRGGLTGEEGRRWSLLAPSSSSSSDARGKWGEGGALCRDEDDVDDGDEEDEEVWWGGGGRTGRKGERKEWVIRIFLASLLLGGGGGGELRAQHRQTPPARTHEIPLQWKIENRTNERKRKTDTWRVSALLFSNQILKAETAQEAAAAKQVAS